ncbi:hypothetical protein AURDEDRAFT_183450 [Auricularia subglabra TFB-10046 SS5]|nr:hypothetical protein AURDEDRAFT_183450 [Auricularia subglabra TFB-10046 SS5]
MSAKKRTPVKDTRRTAREDMKAYFKYVMEDYANHPTEQTDYVANTKALIDDAVWDKILADELVVQAHADWAASVATGTDYAAVTYLLNRISYAYLIHAGVEIGDVVLYSSPHDHPPHGDYLGAAPKADWVAFMASMDDLTTVLRDGPFPPAAQCASFMALAEGKPTPEKRQGQILWYLSSLKRYRPDLFTVHGFKLEGDKLFLASLNPCGVRISETSDGGELELWIAHIVLLYHAHLRRDSALSLLPRAEDSYVRWGLTVAQEDSDPEDPITVVPFNASHCPGRMTWLALQLGKDPLAFATFYREPASGFLKISWQDANSTFNERQLLDIAHGIAPSTGIGDTSWTSDAAPDAHNPKVVPLDQVDWLPGLARHWPNSCRRDAKEYAITGVADRIATSRVKEIMHLASLGQPLSQCEQPSHLINVVFDAIETHRRMLKRKIIHRDVSWYNLLCKPRHHPATGDKLLDDYPSMEFILTGRKAPPASLLVDLDHGAITTTLNSDAYQPRLRRTGTPMFISLELSATYEIEYTFAWSSLGQVVTKLRSVEEQAFFTQAFPDDDGRFMRDLLRVLEAEKTRDGEATTNPDTPHLPRHDVESFYWVLLWAFSRACPNGSDPDGGDISPQLLDTYSQFVNDMLGHKPRFENKRVHYLFSLSNCARLLHPKLARRFSSLLKDIAIYLSVPWHLYDTDLLPDHAHIAVQRLLLLEQHSLRRDTAGDDPKTKHDDVAFNTVQPRVAQVIENAVLSRSMQPTGTGLMSAVEAAAYFDLNQRTVRKQPERGVKRKSEDPPQANDFVFTIAQKKRVKTKLAEEAASEADRVPTAAELVRMIIDDRLWFGTGSRRDQAAADAKADE